MRYSWGLALPFLCPLIAAASSVDEARVLLFPSSDKAHPNRGQKLDAETARLVLSRRLGLSQFYDIGDRSEKDVEQIDRLGGGSQQLLGLEHQRISYFDGQGFVVVEGLESAHDVIPALDGVLYDEFSIPTSPSADDTLELFNSFEDQLRYLESIDQSVRAAVCASVHDIVKPHGLSQSKETCAPWSFSWATGLNSKQAARELKAKLSALLTTAASDGYPFVVVFTSPAPKKSSKRSANVYGEIKPRSSQQEPELILSDSTPTVAAHVSPETGVAQSKANTSNPIRGILPSCFKSQDDCESTTNNCTGHGECVLKYRFSKEGDKGNDEEIVCYACACTKPEVRTNKDGSTKTTRFGGPACQKKDIVMPFWLFTGFTIVFLSVLTWAIGLLYSMGNQELPSVIGAGVSGPAKK